MLRVITALLLTLLHAAPAQADEMTDLRRRRAARAPIIERLKDEGRIGETSNALLRQVHDRDLDDRVAPGKDAPRLRKFLKEENDDRQAQYALEAETSEEKKRAIIDRHARDAFARAKPEHFLRRGGGEWVKKKDLDLILLKSRGKVGETHKGWVKAVHDGFLSDPVNEGRAGGQTIATFLGELNASRERLYREIAKTTGQNWKEVAEQTGARHFREARAEHWLKLAGGKWVKREGLILEPEEPEKPEKPEKEKDE